MLALQPILADFGGLLTIAFLVISFIGWVSNLVSKQQEANKPRKERRPQDRKVRDEIEAFLQEATGQQRPRPQRAARDAEVLSADDVEVVDSRPKQRPKPNRPQPQRKSNPPSKTSPAQATKSASTQRTAPGQQAARRQVPDANLGQSLTQHVQQHMAERVGDQAARDVDTKVDDHVAARMGLFAAEVGAVGRGGPSQTPVASELLKLLRTPQGVKQAYVLGEVLQPPVAMRRQRNS